MEELLKKILERKRSERSSSEESSTSPEAKKARSDEVNSPEEVEEHEVEDEIFTVLNMAEGFHKALEEINRKLEKLDAIQTTVNDVQTELGYKDASTVEIQRVHRLGKKKEEKPRQIIARFLRYKNCEEILALGSRLRGSRFKSIKIYPTK